MLKGLGEAMGENLSQQDVLLTEIDTKVLCTAHSLSQIFSDINNVCTHIVYLRSLVTSTTFALQMDVANKGLKTNNMKLKGLVTQVAQACQLTDIAHSQIDHHAQFSF